MYSDKVKEHFRCPQNARRMADADAEGVFGDPTCGDTLKIYIKVRDNRIVDISYLVFGCCASIATSSMTSILAKGKTLEEAMKIADEDVLEALDGLPEQKIHCSNLGVTALRRAIENYNKKARVKNYINIDSNTNEKEWVSFMDMIHKIMIEKYGEMIVDRIESPRNYEELENANGYISFDGKCGDTMRLWIKVVDDVIEEITFRSNGCEITRATGSMLTEMVKGSKVSEALKIAPVQISEALGGVPENHFHAVILVKDALGKAIENYEENKNRSISRE